MYSLEAKKVQVHNKSSIILTSMELESDYDWYEQKRQVGSQSIYSVLRANTDQETQLSLMAWSGLSIPAYLDCC